jgi:hypothetical protein
MCWFFSALSLCLPVLSTVSSAIGRVSLTRIGYNGVDELVNAVCVTRPFAYVCWLLRDLQRSVLR